MARPSWIGVGTSLFILAACGGSEAPAGDPSAAQQLVIPPMDAGAAPLVVATEPAPAPPPAAGTPDSVDDYTSARDPRAKTPPGPAGALQSQLSALESELRTTPSRPEVLRTIANAYAELARAQGTPSRPAVAARTSSIGYWDTLIREAPTFAQLDEARYYRALAFEQNHDLHHARSGYYDLIKNHPNSAFIACAYFAFGEMFFDEAKNSDPSKWELAKQAYAETIKYPAAKNTCFQIGKSRLAEVNKAMRGP